MTTPRLIVGLANPGPEYAQTRHNAGAWLVETYARQHQLTLSPETKFHGFTARLQQGTEDLRLLIPTTFMNRSGQAVAALAQFYKIAPTEILVVYDELDLPPGVARFKQGGGAGGHNGIKDIISRLGSPDFLRLRIGIGHPGHKAQVTGWVLGKAPSDQQRLMDDTVIEACRAVDILRRDGLLAAQQHLHSFKATLP